MYHIWSVRNRFLGLSPKRPYWMEQNTLMSLASDNDDFRYNYNRLAIVLTRILLVGLTKVKLMK